MFRYIAIVGNADQTSESRRVATMIRAALGHWKCAIDTRELCVLHTGGCEAFGRAYVLENAGGVVLGTLFKAHSDPCEEAPCSLADIDARSSEEIRSTFGRALIDSYWGWYVAFLRPSAAVSILRGPMGDLPCFYTVWNGLHVFFSFFEDVARFPGLAFSINWTFLALQVAFGASVRVGESAVNEVKTLQRGESFILEGDVSRAGSFWSPGKVASGRSLYDKHSVIRAVRATTRSCVRSWASLHSSILIRISGGLDSSVVATCIGTWEARPATGAFTYYSWGMDEERLYAASVCERNSIPLEECRRTHTVDIANLQHVALTCAPVLDYTDWEHNPWERRLARERHATAIFTGSLGDVLFERDAHLSPASDFLFRHGFRRGFASVVSDLALRRRMTLWKVLRHAIQEGVISPPSGPWNNYVRLLKFGMIREERVLVPDAMREVIYDNLDLLIHPWLRESKGIPPGKLWMISLLPVEGFYDAHFREPSDPLVISPYISQPLTELCLRIPTYMNMERGWDRSILRNAFRDDLPDQVYRRTTKGSPGPWLREVVDRNIAFIRKFLLEGILVDKGLVDPSKLGDALSMTPNRTLVEGGIIMNLLYTEAWVRKWTDFRQTNLSATDVRGTRTIVDVTTAS